MKTFVIDFYLQKWEGGVVEPERFVHQFTKAYSTEKDLVQIESEFYRHIGEGLFISSTFYDDLAHFRIEALGLERDTKRFEVFLGGFQSLEEVPNYPEEFNNLNAESFIQLNVDEQSLDSEELEQLNQIASKFSSKCKVLERHEIFEHGASDYWVSYIISFSASASFEIINQLIKYLRSRNRTVDDADNKTAINSINIKNLVKDFLKDEYGLKQDEVFLKQLSLNEKTNSYNLEIESKKERFFITVDSHNNITDFKKRKNRN